MGLQRKTHVYGFMLLSVWVSFSNQAAPTFTNLPDATTVAEDAAVNFQFFQATATDADGDTIVYTMSSSPSDGTMYIALSSTNGAVTVKTILDDGRLSPPTTFVLTITASAGGESVTEDLNVTVSDVPEGLVFDQTGYGVSAAEGQVAGTYLPDPGFTVTDGDNSDTFTCIMACPTASVGDFTMVKSTCLVYFHTAYSVDFGDASSVECVVTATDSTGNTATTTLTITVTSVNSFTPTFTQSSYNFYMSYYDIIGTTIAPAGSIAATDYDSPTFGTVQYSIDQSTLPSPSNYFQIDPTTGVLTSIRELPGSCNCPGQALSFTLIATDDGGLSSTASITVNVDTNTTTVSTTTKRYTTFFDNSDCTLVFTVILLITAAVLVVGGYIIFQCCMNCVRNSYRNLRRNHGPPHRRFDDDYYRPRDRYNRTTRHTPI